jgi:hypothetical protein
VVRMTRRETVLALAMPGHAQMGLHGSLTVR